MVSHLKTISLLLSVILLNFLCTINGQGSNLSTTLGDKEYYIGLTQKVNWYRANQICTSLGMSLASIDSATEQTNLKNYLFSESVITHEFWLSASDLAASKDFTWISSGKKLSVYSNWASSEPAAGTKKRCVQTNAKLEWIVDVCENAHYFICSRPVTPDCGVTGRCSFNVNTLI